MSKYQDNRDIKFELRDRIPQYNCLEIWLNGKIVDEIKEELKREAIAAKPVKRVLKDGQVHLSIGYNLAAGHLTIKQQGVSTDKLPPARKIQGICQSEIVNNNTTDQR